jgi:hypothetical protein
VPHYFLLHRPDFLEGLLLPAFTRSWQERSFTPLTEIALQLRPRFANFQQKFCLPAEDTVLERLIRGIHFDRAVWELAFGEGLFYGAVVAPDAPICFRSMRWLLGSRADVNTQLPRGEWHWIDRALLGSRTFRLGRPVYRLADAGWTSGSESIALLEKLLEVDSTEWTIHELARLDQSWDAEDLEDEWRLAHDALAGLRHIYKQVHVGGYAVVCEYIG